MKKTLIIGLLLVAGILQFSFTDSGKGISTGYTFEDSLVAERKKFITLILDSLKGKESIAADSIFQNLKTFDASQRLQVRHLLSVMNYWGEALGVSCTYCHNSGNWASDEMGTKQIARDMYALRQTLNKEILPKIKGLQSNPARVNCGTCHNGNTLPKK